MRRFETWHAYLKMCIFLSLAIAFAAIVAWIVLLTPRAKVLTGFNYYNAPVKVVIDNTQYNLDTFDSYTYRTSATGKLEVVVFNTAGERIDSREHILDLDPTIIVDYFSEQNSVQKCGVTAEVTDIYFNKGPTALAQNIQPLATGPQTSLTFRLSQSVDSYVYPGNYAISVLASQVPAYAHLYGAYPVDCVNLNDQDKLQEQIAWWASYNPAIQRTLFAQKQQAAQGTTEYSD